MKAILATTVLCWSLMAALWWHVKASPTWLAARQIAPLCPANSTLRGDVCLCDRGTRLVGQACLPVWRSNAPGVTAEQLGVQPHADNCVFFARQRVPSLPYGLGTWRGKLHAINSRAPRVGSVAMIAIASGPYRDIGHVAIVEAVTRDSLTIIEGNWMSGHVTRRVASGKNAEEAARLLKIAGYYRP